MYRDGQIEKELLEGLDKMQESEEYYEETFPWTTFTYHVSTESGRRAIKLGIDNFHENIAQTMLFCKELASIELNYNGKITSIVRKPIVEVAPDVMSAEFEICGEQTLTRRFLYSSFCEYNKELSDRYRADRKIRINAAIEVAKQSGYESITARTVSAQLDCSTQPVMYHFSTIDALKRAVYDAVDNRHTEFLMTVPPEQDPILGIGLNYVRFAVEEPQLFRFLFQSGYAEENSLLEMIDSEALRPVLAAMQEGTGLSMEKTRQVFLTVALFAHGYASIIANNHLEFDEKLIAEHLERTWNGAMLAAAQEESNESHHS
jgi:AcrR family transcriptional regulator